MHEIARSRRVARPADVVWGQLADFGAIGRWARDVDHSCLLGEAGDGDDQVGVVRRIQTGRTTLLERVVVWQPPTVLAYEIEGLPAVVRSARNTWAVTADGTDHALVTLTTHLDCGPRPPQRVVAWVIGRAFARASEGLLASLEAAEHLATGTPSEATARKATA